MDGSASRSVVGFWVRGSSLMSKNLPGANSGDLLATVVHPSSLQMTLETLS